MPEYETSKVSVPESEEVEAYPKVILFVSVNWVECALENPDSERREAFGLAAIFSDSIAEDLQTCRTIGRISGIIDGCERPNGVNQDVHRPHHF